MDRAPAVFTIGHSTHPWDRFLGLLRGHAIEGLCDVRRYPGSRRNPQFNADELAAALRDAGIDYEGLGEALGGRRRQRARSGTAGAAWRSRSFQAYAEHMETEEFAAGIERLEGLAALRRTAIMCAEKEWRRCHRRLISDALESRGWRVLHLRPDGRLEAHEPTLG